MNSFNNEPVAGGEIIEGIVGTPRFVNPVLATTRADQDIAALVYRGLMKLDAEGNLVNDIASEISVSDDGRVYNVRLRDDVRFHNDTPLQARDVSYTIGLIQNPDLKSPLQSSWFGVLIEELGEYELNIVLEEAYPAFIENLTIGILPRDLWDELPIEQLPFSQNNAEPIGAGPFMVDRTVMNRSGLIEEYQLTNSPYYQSDTKLDAITLRFYENTGEVFAALEAGEITSTPSLEVAQLASIDTDKFTIHSAPLPRTFALFFNQNKSPILRDAAARRALSTAIDRQALVNEVLGGFGAATDSPLPPTFVTTAEASDGAIASSSLITKASNILLDNGWVKNNDGIWEKEIDDDTIPLTVSIATANTSTFDATASYVASVWTELGADVSVAQYEQGDLVQAIIRPRDFQVLLFGTDVGRSVDLYSFWHSSQKDDPGLNVSQYTSIEADDILETARSSKDSSVRTESLTEFAAIVAKEQPAIFLFVPSFTYVAVNDLQISPLSKLSKPSERFMNVSDWYINTAGLWPFITDN